MKGYDKQCYTSRKDYHKAKNRYNKKKCNMHTDIIGKSKKYKQELKRVKDKENMSIVQQLRENKNKDPKKILRNIEGDKEND